MTALAALMLSFAAVNADISIAKEDFNKGCSAYRKQDYTEAVKWWRKAAEQGNTDAQYSLGVCYFFGHGVTKDEAEAVKWLRKAAGLGHREAGEMLEYLQK